MYQVPTMQQQTQENFINVYNQAGTVHGQTATPAGFPGVGTTRGFIS
jgi:hypothetical protein